MHAAGKGHSRVANAESERHGKKHMQWARHMRGVHAWLERRGTGMVALGDKEPHVVSKLYSAWKATHLYFFQL